MLNSTCTASLLEVISIAVLYILDTAMTSACRFIFDLCSGRLTSRRKEGHGHGENPLIVAVHRTYLTSSSAFLDCPACLSSPHKTTPDIDSSFVFALHDSSLPTSQPFCLPTSQPFCVILIGRLLNTTSLAPSCVDMSGALKLSSLAGRKMMEDVLQQAASLGYVQLTEVEGKTPCLTSLVG